MDTNKYNQCTSQGEDQYTKKWWWNLITRIHKINEKMIMQIDLLNWLKKYFSRNFKGFD